MRFPLALAACAAALPLLAGCDDPNRPDRVRGMRPIVFVGRTWTLGGEIGPPKLYIVRPDGSDLRRLTTGPGEEFTPAWSPDGRTIAYYEGDQIRLADADGSNARTIAGAPTCVYTPPTHLSWSPDGTRLAAGCWFVTSIVPIQGGGSYSLSDRIGGEMQYPDWSPVGDLIAFGPSSFGMAGVNVVHSDGTDMRLQLPGRAEEATWSPDGKRFAYLGGPEGIRTLMIANADGSGAHEVMDRTIVPGAMWGPEWSPDGQYLTFMATSRYCETRGSPPAELCDVHYGIYIVDVNGQDLRKINPISLQGGRPTW